MYRMTYYMGTEKRQKFIPMPMCVFFVVFKEYYYGNQTSIDRKCSTHREIRNLHKILVRKLQEQNLGLSILG